VTRKSSVWPSFLGVGVERANSVAGPQRLAAVRRTAQERKKASQGEGDLESAVFLKKEGSFCFHRTGILGAEVLRICGDEAMSEPLESGKPS